MNWRTILMLALLAALGIGSWWLNGLMETQGWVVFKNQKWVIAGTGWETLKHAWPIAIAGMLIGGGILYALLGYLYLNATDADHKNEIDRITAQKALSDEKAKNAMNQANESLKADREALRSYERQLIDKERRLDQLQEEATERVATAESRANDAIQAANDAEKRRQNAAGAAERRRRKLEKVNSQQETKG